MFSPRFVVLLSVLLSITLPLTAKQITLRNVRVGTLYYESLNWQLSEAGSEWLKFLIACGPSWLELSEDGVLTGTLMLHDIKYDRAGGPCRTSKGAFLHGGCATAGDADDSRLRLVQR